MSLILDYEHQHEPVWAEIPKRPAPPKPGDPIEELRKRRSKRKCIGKLIGRRGIVCGAPLIQWKGESDNQFRLRHLCAGRHADETPALLRPVRLRAAAKRPGRHPDVLEGEDAPPAKPEQVDQFAREAGR